MLLIYGFDNYSLDKIFIATIIMGWYRIIDIVMHRISSGESAALVKA